MAKPGVEEQIRNLSRLRETPVTETTTLVLRRGLADRVNLVGAKAAQVIGDLRLTALIPEMVAAFGRAFQNGPKTDPQCWAKNAIAKALTDLDYDEAAPFLQGCRYVQMEPVWGGQADTAVTLRSLCTLGLVQCTDLSRADKLRHLVASLTDLAESVRIDAIRALEQMGGEDAALLLRLKAGIGDRRASVQGQVLESLLRTEGPRALEFIRPFLEERQLVNPREFDSSGDEFIEEAALALGSARLPEGVEVLKEAWAKQPRPVFLHAISVARLDTGFEFLHDLIRNGRERDAVAALEALSLHRDSSEVQAATAAAVEARGGSELQEQLRVKFRTL